MAGGDDDKRTPRSSSSSSRWRKPGSRHGPGLEKRSSECEKEGPCSSSPSVWIKKAQLQMVTPVQQSKSEGSLPQSVTQVQPLKSVDSPPQMVTPVQPSEFVDSLCQMVTPVPVGLRHSALLPKTQLPHPKGGEKVEVPLFRRSASTTPPMAGGDDKRTPGSSSPSSRWRKPGARYGLGLEKRSSECQKDGPCSSSPSVWSKKAQQQMVTPVQQSISEGSLPQTATQVQPLKSVDSPPQMVTPVQPSEFVDSLCQMVGSVQISDSLDSRSTSCASDSVVGSGPGAAPFDIIRGVSKCSVEVKPSLLDINREKRRAKELAKSPNALQHLRPGMVLLKNFLEPDDQVKIIKQCGELGVGTGGFYQPCYKDGAKLSLRMMCLGKNWDPDSSSYVDRRPFDGAQPPKIPEELTKFVRDAIDAAHAFLKQSGGQGTSNPLKEIPRISPDICIVNFYTTAGKLGLHQDKDETKNSLDKNLPVISFSLGDTAEFLYGDTRDEAKASKIKLESGDVLIFGGQSRHIFHGVSTITPKTAPTYVTEQAKLRPGRLNLTFRQY